MRALFFFPVVFLLLVFTSCSEKDTEKSSSNLPVEEAWTPLFDGQSLDGWIPKIRGYEVGNNYAQTFRVSDGAIQVGYDQYEGEFQNRFGHLFYEAPFSSYKFRMQYRFTGEQAPGGAGWAWRNSGIMIHCQDPKSMVQQQDFPLCIEVQLLGGDSTGDRSTANLCTPGSHVEMGDSLHTDHCTNSTSHTYRGDQWVSVMVEVYADSLIRHIVEGDTVMTYFRPQVGGGSVSPTSEDFPVEGTPLTRGWISLQSESHPVEFRAIEIMEL